MHEVLVNRLGGLSLPRKSVVRLTDRPDMTLDVYRGRKTTIQQDRMLRIYSGQSKAKLILLVICSGSIGTMNFLEVIAQGPIVQSIFSLMSSLRGQLVKCFMIS